MATLLNQADFARRRGVGKSAVSNWKKAGLIVFAEGEGGRLLVDVARTEARLNARLDPTRGRPIGNDAGPMPELPMAARADDDADEGSPVSQRTLAKVRAENAEEDLVGKRMKNAELARELVPAVEAERRLSDIGRMARERAQAEMRGIAERVAAERDTRAVMTLLDEAIDRAFHAVADAVESGALDRGDDDDDDAAAEAA